MLGVSLVRSPLEGTVIERRIVTGQSVRGERVVFVIADLNRLLLDVAGWIKSASSPAPRR